MFPFRVSLGGFFEFGARFALLPSYIVFSYNLIYFLFFEKKIKRKQRTPRLNIKVSHRPKTPYYKYFNRCSLIKGAIQTTTNKNNIKTIFYIIKMDTLDALGVLTIAYFIIAPCYLFYVFISYLTAYFQLFF
jgi:hypothetical protein